MGFCVEVSIVETRGTVMTFVAFGHPARVFTTDAVAVSSKQKVWSTLHRPLQKKGEGHRGSRFCSHGERWDEALVYEHSSIAERGKGSPRRVMPVAVHKTGGGASRWLGLRCRICHPSTKLERSI